GERSARGARRYDADLGDALPEHTRLGTVTPYLRDPGSARRFPAQYVEELLEVRRVLEQPRRRLAQAPQLVLGQRERRGKRKQLCARGRRQPLKVDVDEARTDLRGERREGLALARPEPLVALADVRLSLLAFALSLDCEVDRVDGDRLHA